MNSIDNLTQIPPIPTPPLVRRGWWIKCIPAILGLSAYFIIPMIFGDGSFDVGVYLEAMMLAGFLISYLFVAWGYWRLSSRVVHCEARMCTICGYDLKMAPDMGTCSECGTPYQIIETILAWSTWKKKSLSNPASRPLKDVNKKHAVVVWVVLWVVFLGIYLVTTVPSRMENSRAKHAADVADVALDEARKAWGVAMNRASGATDAERNATAHAADAASIAALDAATRSAEAASSLSRATSWGVAGFLAVLASVVLWKFGK